MSNAIGTSPSAMITRIADREGASSATLLAKVAQLRGAMATEQAQPETTAKALLQPTNGAEVDLLV